MMNTIRFILEPYNGQRTRHTCTRCGAPHEFSRYIDTENGNAYLDDRVGKCNRTNNCNYHYTPKQYFADNGFPGDFKKSPYKSRKARTAAALSRVFSGKPTLTPTPEQENVSENDLSKEKAKLQRLQKEMKACQHTFENSPAQEYLQRRGITPKTAKAFGCGYAAEWKHWEKDNEDRWQMTGTDRRVVFPITDNEGNVLAIHGRAIDAEFLDTPKKTKGSRKEALFQSANDFDADIIFLCEGPADAMALHECGFAAVASVATSIPSWLPNRLAFRKVMVALDADETGDQAAEKHINELRAHGARAVRLRPEGGKDWNDILMKAGANALRRFVEEKITAAFPDYELLIEPQTETEHPPEDFPIADVVFGAENKSGQMAIDWLFASAKNHDADALLLGMPTVRAFDAGKELINGVNKHSKGKLTDAQLKALTDRYINAHLRSDDISDAWTGKEVPSFYLTVKINGEREDSLTCNLIQSWIVRELWLRKSPKTQIDIMNL